MITIFPAIDIKNGKCVRLVQGRADKSKIYSEDPVATARRWVGDGGTFLHVVDLDGAFTGRPVHTEIIAGIVKVVDIPVEAGGGLRTSDDVERLLDIGITRAIIGTSACVAPDRLKRMADRFPGRLAVAIDARHGAVQVSGWVETTEMKALDLARRVQDAGITTIIYTDTAADGMLTGVNAAAVDAMCAAVSCDVVASGGLSSADDIRRLAELKRPNLVAAIVGRALYEGKTTIRELAAAGA
jgi:phosphoribosylformimino-5-aminoimidazole carboxamide ribotide isomerase